MFAGEPDAAACTHIVGTSASQRAIELDDRFVRRANLQVDLFASERVQRPLGFADFLNDDLFGGLCSDPAKLN